MMKQTVIAISIILLVTNCRFMPDYGIEEERKQWEELSNWMIFCSGTSTTVSQDTDRNDGTIERFDTTTRISPCFGTVITYQTIYFKKCMQGQVYRSVENDCQGTGNSGDLWGAQLFQLCATTSPEDCIMRDGQGDRVIDPATSPAAQSCAADSTAGKSWALAYDLSGLNSKENIRLPDFNPDLPKDPGIFFWDRASTGVQSDAGIAMHWSYSFGDDGFPIFTRRVKDESGYVICSTEPD